jgi:hypothetical protein
MKVGSAELGGGLLGELSMNLSELLDIFPAACMIVRNLRSRILLLLSSTSLMDLPAMAWRFPVAPSKVELANLAFWPPARPKIGSGARSPFKRVQLGSMRALERRRMKFSGRKLVGVDLLGGAGER